MTLKPGLWPLGHRSCSGSAGADPWARTEPGDQDARGLTPEARTAAAPRRGSLTGGVARARAPWRETVARALSCATCGLSGVPRKPVAWPRSVALAEYHATCRLTAVRACATCIAASPSRRSGPCLRGQTPSTWPPGSHRDHGSAPALPEQERWPSGRNPGSSLLGGYPPGPSPRSWNAESVARRVCGSPGTGSRLLGGHQDPTEPTGYKCGFTPSRLFPHRKQGFLWVAGRSRFG
jgi:hypothetical protein